VKEAVATSTRVKTQMSARYPQSIADQAHTYALAHGLSLNALLSMALAEYLAKRESGALPAPQLHYRKGHPPAELVRLQQELMRRDPRGRKMVGRCERVSQIRPAHCEEELDRRSAGICQRTEASLAVRRETR
jgi:hypothetical protein